MPRFLKEYLETKSVVMRPYNKNLKLPSRDSRNNMTDAEQWLWQRLRRKQILGLQFGGVSKSMLKKSRLNFDKIEKCK